MKRRAVLATASGSLVLGLAGCICPGETWPGLGYDITLDEISYNTTTDQWEGRCSLWVSFSFASDDSDFGISNAGIALYGEDGHRTALLEFGDLTWQDVTASNRSDMGCEGYESGDLTRTSEFEVSEFPEYFGLWYSYINNDEYGSSEALEYRGMGSGTEPTDISQWRSVEQPYRGLFPPIPSQRPELGEDVEDAEVTDYSRDCSDDDPTPSVYADGDNWTLEISGAFHRANALFVPGIDRVALREEADILDVVVQMRPFVRPPELPCDSVRTEYSIGIDLFYVPPQEVDVTHRDVDGNKIASYRLET